MNKEQKISAFFAVLFSSGEPMSIDRLATVFEEKPEKIEETANLLEKRLKEQKMGIMLLRLQNTYQLASEEQYAEYIKRAFDIKRRTPLSPAALEVLAVVAYNQPVTKSFVEQVRGVDSSYTMGILQDRGLIEPCGRLQVPGRPVLFRTTKVFLRCFGISSLDDLPPMPDITEDMQGQLKLEQAIAELTSSEQADEEKEQ